MNKEQSCVAIQKRNDTKNNISLSTKRQSNWLLPMNAKEEEKRDRIVKLAFECRVQLTAYAYALLGDYSTADDAVQDAMLTVVKKYDQFTEGTSIMAWCRSIVRLETLRIKHKHHKDRTIAMRLLEDSIDSAFDEFWLADQPSQGELRRKALIKCLGNLTNQGRQILQSRFAESLSYEQIGIKIGMSLEAVRKSLYRQKKQLRDCVEINVRNVE
jgi:RNA polymerase sigma-70 factor (ECF subfamily)